MPPQSRPTFGTLVGTYFKHRNRDYLARLLQIWSPAMDEEEGTALIGSALHRAIFIGDETAVRMILDAGVSPTVQDSQLYSPLATAAEAGQRDITRLLWELVGPDGRAAPLRSPNCLVVAAEKGHTDLVADFLDMWDGWPMDEKRQALYSATGAWRDGVVSVLLPKVAYEADTIQHALEVGVTQQPILSVARWGSFVPITKDEEDLRQQRVVCHLIDAGANLDVLASGGRIPLIHAAAEWRHRLGALRGLLEKGADANVRDGHGKTALHRLFQRHSSSSADALRILLQHGASPELADKAGETGLHAAAHTGTLEQFQLCLAACGDEDAALRLHNSYDESLLHYAAAGGREDTVRFLLSRGLDANAANANGWTPLICALMPAKVRQCYPQCSLASLLLEHGASAQAVTEEGWTALHALASYPSGYLGLPFDNWDDVTPLVRELIAHGAPLDAKVSSLRNPAVSYKMFVSPNPDAWGVRMRSFARNWGGAASCSSAAVKTLGNGGEGAGTTPQMWAQRNGANEVVKAILEHQAEAAGEAES
ncbi:ankyrin repeat-containing domain protein [Chaetomium strumarium]|uniref:Ankyrin repeat-containing domain protein n=1 Tax=Chaetomium strumarium TaxID=1170767 RepID=A0AAJ0M3H0_9PEZI|nr:ankyrin repeat-containing domain protein [Chaetomium strumarium]